jgi:uncharacterized protein (TIGR02118 family)
MQKLVILVDPAENENAFEKGWPAFLALAEKLPGLRREATSHVENIITGKLDYSLVHELYFDSMEDMKQALASPVGRMAGTKLQEITHGRVTLYYADHTEDSAENLQRIQPEGGDAPSS